MVLISNVDDLSNKNCQVLDCQLNSPYFCDSPKNACGIQTKGLERV